MIAIGGLSVLVIGMVTCTALGHLSRPLKLDFSMLSSYCFVLAALTFRMMAIIPSPWSLGLHSTVRSGMGCCLLALHRRFAPMLTHG